MMDEQLNAASDAIEAAIRQSTVGIVSGSGNEKWQGIGTGTIVCWRGRHLILTAEHVIAGTPPEDIRFFFRHDAPPIKVERETILNLPDVPTAALKWSSEIELGRLVTNPEMDLAAIEVDSSLDKKYPSRFFDLAEGGRTPAEGQQTIVMGFPYDISRLTHKNERVVFSQLEWTDVAPNREHLKDFDPAKHFLAPYKLSDIYPDANPKGFSGSACGFTSATRQLCGAPTSTLLASRLTGIHSHAS